MTAVVVGASSGLGRALAERLASDNAARALLLVASDTRDLDAVAADLQIRFGARVSTLALDLASGDDLGARIVAALADMPPLDALFLAVGWSRSDDDFSLDAAAIERVLAINLRAPIAIAHALLPALLAARGAIVGFGSVAAVRGRGRNVVYAAAKRGLESTFESLRQRYTPAELRVQFWRLGFVRTNLTFGMRLPLPAVDAARVAEEVASNVPRGSFARTFPRWWALVALALRALPWSIYRRLKQ